jgi:hypothetical protein
LATSSVCAMSKASRASIGIDRNITSHSE